MTGSISESISDRLPALISAEASIDANVIWGVNFDEELEDEMRVTIIATGFDNQNNSARKNVSPTAPVVAASEPVPAPKAEPVKREKPKASADEELDRLMKEFSTPKKKKIGR